MVDPSLQEINDREAQDGDQDQPTNPDDDGGDDGSTGMLDDLPIPAISKKHLVLVAVVVVAILVWQSRSGSSGGTAAEEMQKARQGDFSTEVEAKPTGGPGEPDAPEDYDPEEAGRARIPVNPQNELEKDKAALEFLVENGTISGGEN